MPEFTPGHKKFGGRKKGVPNKDKAEAQAKAVELGVDPFEVLLLFARGDWKALGYESERVLQSCSEFGEVYKFTIDPNVRAKCAAEACQFMLPKLKAIDISARVDMSLVKEVEEIREKGKPELIAAMKAEIKRLEGE